MKLVYTIAACDEHEELTQLLTQLTSKTPFEDYAIVVVIDTTKINAQMMATVAYFSVNPKIEFVDNAFNGNFSDLKNLMNSMATNYNCRWIFNIDADETPTDEFLRDIELILSAADDSDVDAISIPRANYVHGITDYHINRWGWIVDTHGRINWPDYQVRLYRNLPRLVWSGTVHETLSGITRLWPLPDKEIRTDTGEATTHPPLYFLKHPKTIERQERQNSLYAAMIHGTA